VERGIGQNLAFLGRGTLRRGLDQLGAARSRNLHPLFEKSVKGEKKKKGNRA